MISYRGYLAAILMASSTSLALAQSAGGDVPRSPFRPAPMAQPAPLAPVAPATPDRRNVPTSTCDPGGCWGTDGARYNRSGGNFMLGSNGRMCRIVAAGAPLVCE